jgi:hypothetical protein
MQQQAIQPLGGNRQYIYCPVNVAQGLTPRYLIPQQPPAVPPHAGTMDVDVVVDLQILADTEAYESIEANLKRLGFERGENDDGKKVSWRWQTKTEHGAKLILEFLADDPTLRASKVQPLPTKGNISAPCAKVAPRI